MSRVQVQAYLDEGLAAKLVAAAQEADRSLSREVVRRLEASFAPAARALLEAPGPPAVQRPARVPPETSEPRAEVVERLQQQVPGVVKASAAFPSVPQDLARQVTPRPRGGS